MEERLPKFTRGHMVPLTQPPGGIGGGAALNDAIFKDAIYLLAFDWVIMAMLSHIGFLYTRPSLAHLVCNLT